MFWLLLGLCLSSPLHHRTQKLNETLEDQIFLEKMAEYLNSAPNRDVLGEDIIRIVKHKPTPPDPQAPQAEYWWYFPKSDCGYDDVPGSCAGQSVDACKSICLSTPGCGGFNTNGYLKKTDCLSHLSAAPSCDLYVLQSSPQPPMGGWPPIWPYPASFTNGTTTFPVNALTFAFNTTTPSSDITAAFNRYQSLFFPHRSVAPSSPSLSSVIVSAADTSGVLQLGTDESYSLVIKVDGSAATITANTVFGVMRGLETLSQLVFFNFTSKTYYIPGAPWVINDAPRFSHRELLVDTARHFQPVQSLMNLIDSLPYAKVNVLHWHLVDSQSFPFDSPSRPLLSQMGAFSFQEHYSTEDIQDVVEYARQRGVRTVVEFDTPGHAESWCDGYPTICPSPTCLSPLNPATEDTFSVISDLFFDATGGKQGAGLFPDNMIHLGGDEVDMTCWSTTPSIQQWMTSNGYTTTDAYFYFVNRTQAIARGYGRTPIGWEEIWDNFGTKLDKSTIIQQWEPGSSVSKQAIAAGYRCLWSTDGVWYLDGLDTTWQTMYAQEPCTGIDPTLCVQYMLGGGGEMWGETVDTSDLQNTVWPRLAAIAERLWSPQSITDENLAQPRYAGFRCLLNRRGIGAAPANNPEAREAPPGPGGCYYQ